MPCLFWLCISLVGNYGNLISLFITAKCRVCIPVIELSKLYYQKLVTWHYILVLGRLWLFKKRSIRFRSILAANVAVSISISIFLTPIISDGRMYRRRIDVAMFVLSIGTISDGHNGQLRQRGSAWTDVIVVQIASWAVNYSGHMAYGSASATGAGTRWVGETS